MMAGQGVALVDRVQPAAEIIAEIIAGPKLLPPNCQRGCR